MLKTLLQARQSSSDEMSIPKVGSEAELISPVTSGTHAQSDDLSQSAFTSTLKASQTTIAVEPKSVQASETLVQSPDIATSLILLGQTIFMGKWVSSVLKKLEKPSPTGWAIWAANDLLLTASAITSNVEKLWILPALFATCSTLGTLIALKFGQTKKLTKNEKLCIASALAGVTIYGLGLAAKNISAVGDLFGGAAASDYFNVMAATIAIGVNFLGTIPNMISFRRKPAQEEIASKHLSTLGLLTTLTVKNPWSYQLIPSIANLSFLDISTPEGWIQPLGIMLASVGLFWASCREYTKRYLTAGPKFLQGWLT